MLLFRDGIRVANFLRLSTASNSIYPRFYGSFRPILCPSNCRLAKKTLASFHMLEKKQYFCSSTTDDITIESAKVIGTDETTTAVDEQKQPEESSGEKTLAKQFMHYMAAGGAPRFLSIELEQGRSGVKFVKFTTHAKGHFFHSPNFLVPEEAYLFIRAMDELLGVLAAKEGVKSIPSTGSRLLFSTSWPGQFYDVQLNLKWADGRFLVDLGTRRTVAKPDHKERDSARNGQDAGRFDGTQPVDEPSKLPEWLSIDCRPRRQVQLQMPIQTAQNGRERQQMPMKRMPMMELAQRERPNQYQLVPLEHFVKRFNTGNMDKSAMARGENVLAKMQLSSFGLGEVPEQLEIVLEQDQADGTKFVEFRKEIGQELINHCRKIRVPLEVYPFARAMDLLLGKLAMEEDGQKMPSTESRVLFSTSSPGMANDFKLDLMLVDGHFVVKLGTCQPGDEHKEMKPFWLSVKEFYWFRMGDILAKFDGSQQLDLPPKLPDWLLKDDRPIPRSGQYPNPVPMPNRNMSAERYPSQYRQNNRQSRVPQPYNNNNNNNNSNIMTPLAQQRQQQPRTWPRQAETAGNYRQYQQPAMTWEFGGGGQGHSTKGQCGHGPGQDKLDDAFQEDEK